MPGYLAPQHETNIGSDHRYRRRALGFYLCLLLIMAATLGSLMVDQYLRDLAVGRERVSARADLVVEWVTSTFETSDQIMAGLIRLFDSPMRSGLLVSQASPSGLESLLRQRSDDFDTIEVLSILDGEGRLIASSRPDPVRGQDLSARAYFRPFEEDPELDEWVSPLIASNRGDSYHLVQVRRLRDDDGQSLGLLVAYLDPAVLTRALDGLSMARGESIGIIDTRMQLLARRPSFTHDVRPDVLGTPIVEPLTRRFIDSSEKSAHVRTQSPLDGEERVYAFQRVGDLPLVVVVGEETAVLLAGWYHRLWILGVVALLIAALGGLALRHYFNRLSLEAELRRRVIEARHAEQELRIAATAFETHLGMLITDAETTILRVNDTFTRITGYREDEVVGRNPSMLSSGRHDASFYDKLWKSVREQGNWQGEIWNRRKNGEVFPEWLTISAVSNDAGEMTHYVATLSDISERKAAEQEIHQLAFFDPLTGLPNRRLLMDRLEVAMKDSYRSGQFTALLFIDLDNFQQINDILGHYLGDQLLQKLALRLDGVLRDTDTLSRVGGDEFALLLHDLGAEQEHAAHIAERVTAKLLGMLASPVTFDHQSIAVTASIGITLFRDHGTSLDEVFQQADMALFQAKQAGCNTLRFFDPDMQAQLQVRARLEIGLRQALSRDEFRLFYQIQVNAAGETIGVEGLLRWEHPERGIVSPAEFIPLAEENGLIVGIGAWVLETACRQLSVWASDPAMAALVISVNVSPRQFREADFVERVLRILDATGAPADRLKLEVTESLFMEERDDARAKMLRLRERSVRFSLDDFGTGYSSLSYLKQLPLDELKIDQSFVRTLFEDDAGAAIVASTIALSKSLSLEAVAEGVETEAQRDWLVAHGCHAFQGYLFGRPVPVESLPFTD